MYTHAYINAHVCIYMLIYEYVNLYVYVQRCISRLFERALPGLSPSFTMNKMLRPKRVLSSKKGCVSVCDYAKRAAVVDEGGAAARQWEAASWQKA